MELLIGGDGKLFVPAQKQTLQQIHDRYPTRGCPVSKSRISDKCYDKKMSLPNLSFIGANGHG